MSRRHRECALYQAFEGLCRVLIDAGKKKIDSLSKGNDLSEIVTMLKANARYAQQRVQWIEEDLYSWNQIEASECLTLDQEMIRKYKSSKILTKKKLQRLMQDQRDVFLEKAAKEHKAGGNSGGQRSSVKQKRQALQISQLQAKLEDRANKRTGGLFGGDKKKGRNGKQGSRGGSDKPFCKWCKRARRFSAMHSHASHECDHKPPNETD